MSRRERRHIEAVALGDIDTVHWGRLPASIRRALVDGVALVATVRERLRTDVCVESLPPVRVYDALWADPSLSGLIVDGRAAPIRQGGATVFGVELSGPIALLGDEARIRAVLIHEFGHCFYYAKRVIDVLDAGGPYVIDDRRPGDADSVYYDEAADRAALVEPSDWFSEAVARDFPYWNDPRLKYPDDDATLARFKALRIEEGVRPFSVDRIAIHDDVADRIRTLRRRAVEARP